MRNSRIPLWIVIAVVLVAAAAIAAVVLVPMLFQAPWEVHRYSFEASMDGWAAAGTDLEYDGGTLNWSIARSEEDSKDGVTSLRLYLENWNDAGKIWVEKGFEVEVGRTYAVRIEFAFASADFGMANLWTIIAGAMSEKPETGDDLEPTFQDSTGNGMDSDSGFIWMEKSYDATVDPRSDGVLWVVIGVWGTWETPRTYFVDEVKISVRPV